jgi:hypothetical protein
MELASAYKQEQLMKQEQQSRLQAINSTAYNLFIQECARLGVPKDEEESTKLIEKCFSSAEIVQDYFRKQFEPFI